MKKKLAWIFLILLLLASILLFVFPELLGSSVSYIKGEEILKDIKSIIKPIPQLDTVAYDKKLIEIANNPPDPIVYETIKTVTKDENGKSVTKTSKVPVDPQPVVTHLWPVKTAYPNAGAILPFKRIVAYYGNLYSKGMGVLGEYPESEMLAKLDVEVKKWEIADPSTPVLPALHYIALVAQASPGDDGKYRARMPYSEIDKVLEIAKKIQAIVFLDIQVGFSNVQTEIPLLKKYLKMPQVHLGIDPEFSMKGTIRPGKVVGTVDASDINFAVNYLSEIVKENKLTPKILVIHRYTQKMVTNYDKIIPLPEVQIVMDMDGWGTMARKIGTYKNFIYPEPVQFTGFKLFYKNDIWEPNTVLMTPEDILKLNPRPSYIQYQ
ncbi:hypothetical protein A2456_01490 [Candidatus Nomurabacteria bacterium RIFOXYC2_FULL_36_19]|uniref:Lipoprotein n=1 Tax=Candidatus Nomurabacteria bacterium RIFOXYC2_FULL_36_19 TaxID=1801806 RepID=A0A1F6YWB2_9BACT|nr:MAG: hypothetical protein A2456_01490 [Candidatus Nomurabacteria bacterium RIFOXYC2_FULL_36_19]